MFEDDYLLRLIKEMVRTVLKLVFNLELKDDDPVSVVFESENAEKMLYLLTDLADLGFIDDAENQLYDFTQNSKDMEALKVALLFYSHLNQMDNEFLEDHDYSREEIVSGVKDVLERYHLDSMSALF
ncbi:DUF6483 family protein [Fusicatenibacter sp.]|mgnify:FL=1